METYDWPGNVRELENEVFKVLSLAENDDIIGLDSLNLVDVASEFEDSPKTKEKEADTMFIIQPLYPKPSSPNHKGITQKVKTFDTENSFEKGNHKSFKGTGKAKIFISYAKEDLGAVIEVYQKLRNMGFEPWLDEFNLLPGQNWQMEIPKAIRASDIVLVFFSTNSVSKRGYVQKEFKLALDTLAEIPSGQIFVIPIRLDDCEVPDNFRDIHYCNLFQENGFNTIIKAINSRYLCKL